MTSLRFLLLFLTWIVPITALASFRPTVYIIRHGEKDVNSTDSGLNRDGIKRAECLRTVFGAYSPYNIGYIMAPHINSKGQHRRSYDTVLPLAQDLGIPVDTSCKRNGVNCVKKKVHKYKGHGNILISWRHGRMQQIVEALGSASAPEYPKDRFDLIWTDSFPYVNITDIRSEACPELDIPNVLKVQVQY